MSTVDLRTLVERLACIASQTHAFSVQIAKVLPGTPPAAARHVLHIEVRRTGCEHSVARMRITAPISELARIPILVSRALDESLLTPTPSPLVANE